MGEVIVGAQAKNAWTNLKVIAREIPSGDRWRSFPEALVQSANRFTTTSRSPFIGFENSETNPPFWWNLSFLSLPIVITIEREPGTIDLIILRKSSILPTRSVTEAGGTAFELSNSISVQRSGTKRSSTNFYRIILHMRNYVYEMINKEWKKKYERRYLKT